jgi:outer membrane protein OmpA-like peptidoglycan-associated protein
VLPEPEEPIVQYIIRPVFFGFDRSDLTQEAKSTLNDLVEILEIYPALEIQAVGHTDHKGPDSYNMMLSKKRSASVVEYIRQKGIDGKRIQSVARGENQPVAINAFPDGKDSPEGRKLNRRVEIVILRPNLPNVRVEEVQVPDALQR